jgi:hypothetical protein
MGMTKQQAIKKLQTLGVTNILPHGKFQIEAVVRGYKGIFDPRDLLAEIEEYDRVHEVDTTNEQAS